MKGTKASAGEKILGISDTRTKKNMGIPTMMLNVILKPLLMTKVNIPLFQTIRYRIVRLKSEAQLHFVPHLREPGFIEAQ